MNQRIGIIGLGIMGGAFARNLVGAGWSVVGYDTEPQRNAEAKAAGVEIAHSAQAVTETAADIILSLPTPRAVLDTAEVIARSGARSRAVVEASTLSLAHKMAVKDTLEQAGHTALDCPMSGTGAQAAVKDLVVLASGDSAAIKRLEPAFLGFARKVFDLGPYGNGSKMKFVANHLVAIHNVAAAEAMVLAMKAGLDLRQTVEVVSAGAGTSRVFELRAPMMAANTYLPATMRSTTWKKDLTVIGEFASDLGCPTPLFGLAAMLHAAALAMGHGAEDSAAVCAALERMAGIER
ncbi:MAG TPA: NAD(P)-dependent oxidoreductase [Hyphomicrobiaceae bacterium]|jgi:3-hydroxyisobutyrate dehydrogenase-like beta-hydroxyacid dehydrogenase|nr:NAD(P)-dependent oxidoreductase [Hyphomicrobiaceae bacterium]